MASPDRPSIIDALSGVWLMSTALLISASAWAAEPYAWVLWEKSAAVSHSGAETFGTFVTPQSAYPSAGYRQCVEDARARAARPAESAKRLDHVKRVERSHLMGDQEGVTVEMKYGQTNYTTYMCFPHPVKPQ